VKSLERDKEMEEKFSRAEELFRESTLESIEAAISLFKEVVKLTRDSAKQIYIPKIEEYLKRIKGIIEDYSKTGEDYKKRGWTNEGKFYCKVAERLEQARGDLETWIPLAVLAEKEALPPKPPAKKVVPKLPSIVKKPKKPIKAKKKRESKHPGKERLKELIEQHQAKVDKIAKDLKTAGSNISRWICQDPELKKLAEEKRKERIKRKPKPAKRVKIRRSKAKKKKPRISKIKTIDELKELMTSGARKRISWAYLPNELHKALVKELARETGKEFSKLTQGDYLKFKLPILNNQSLGGFYHHHCLRNTGGKPTPRFILEKLGLIEEILSIKEIKTKEALKELLVSGSKVKSWNQIDQEIQKALVLELSQKAKKKVQDLVKEDYERISLPSLDDGTLTGFYQHYKNINETSKRTAYFILETLGLTEKIREIEEIKEPEELKKLLISKATLIIRWNKVNKEVQEALVKELAQKTGKELYQLDYQDFANTHLDSLDGRTLKDMYVYHRRQNKTGKPVVRYILEELGLVSTEVKALRDVKNTKELKELLDSGTIRQISWFQLPKQVQAMLVRELAKTVKPPKKVTKLTQKDYLKVPLSSLNGNTLGGLHLHYSKINTTGKLTTRFILEELGFLKNQTE